MNDWIPGLRRAIIEFVFSVKATEYTEWGKELDAIIRRAHEEGCDALERLKRRQGMYDMVDGQRDRLLVKRDQLKADRDRLRELIEGIGDKAEMGLTGTGAEIEMLAQILKNARDALGEKGKDADQD